MRGKGWGVGVECCDCSFVAGGGGRGLVAGAVVVVDAGEEFVEGGEDVEGLRGWEGWLLLLLLL